MADQVIDAPGTGNAPFGYTLAGSTEIVPRSIRAVFNGASTATAFAPCLVILDKNGEEVGRYPTATTVAAGGSAEVTWFPGLAAAALGPSGGLPVFHDYTPVVSTGGVPLTDPDIQYAGYWSTGVNGGLMHGAAIINFGTDLGMGTDRYVIQPHPDIGGHEVSVGGVDVIGTGHSTLSGSTRLVFMDLIGGISGLDSSTHIGPYGPGNGQVAGDTLFDGSWSGSIVVAP